MVTRQQAKLMNKARKVAYQAQRDLRVELMTAIQRVRKSASGRLIVLARMSAARDGNEFRQWLMKAMQSDGHMTENAKRVGMYLIRSRSAIGGMNHYLENVAADMAKAVRNVGIEKKSKAIAASLSAAIKQVVGNG